MKLSQGDTVLVISGKDKGKKGVIMKVFHDTQKVLVADVNMRTKHVKRTAQAAGSKITFEAAIPACNVMALDPKTGKPTRLGFKVDPKTGKKVRIAKVSGSVYTRTKIDKKMEDKGAKVMAAKKEGAAKSSFWNKKGAAPDAAADAGARPADTAAVPSQPTHTRSAGRGS